MTEEDVKKDLSSEFTGEIGSIFTPFWDVPVTLKPGPSVELTGHLQHIILIQSITMY